MEVERENWPLLMIGSKILAPQRDHKMIGDGFSAMGDKWLLQQSELQFDQKERSLQLYGLASYWVFPWHTDGK